ncbi:MAG: hypothetical protein JWO07_330, partial [Candidatus Saccharibacteria bacterium]|nr:hypothetical protein [Candidatus Saccharibacteria bacterium]
QWALAVDNEADEAVQNDGDGECQRVGTEPVAAFNDVDQAPQQTACHHRIHGEAEVLQRVKSHDVPSDGVKGRHIFFVGVVV